MAYGGAFYGSVNVRSMGLAVDAVRLPRLIALQRDLRPALDAALDVAHPEEPELRGVYGITFWQDEPTADGDGAALTQRNVTVFADGEVDRSPCGSGTSARLAILHAQGRLRVGDELRHRSIVDSAFAGRIVDTTAVAGRAAVVTEVEGQAYLTGRHAFSLDPADPIGTGFSFGDPAHGRGTAQGGPPAGAGPPDPPVDAAWDDRGVIAGRFAARTASQGEGAA